MAQQIGRTHSLTALLACGMALVGCETSGSTAGIANRDLIGAGAGAATGYLACKLLDGNNVACALAAVGGGAAGVFVARRLLDDDKEPRAVALAEVVEGDSRSEDWRSADTGSSGTISLLGTSTGANGEACKTVEEVYTIRGEAPITEQFTLCQASNGQWQTVG